MEEFERIYAKHVNTVLRYARRCVGREDVAEEIVSEAFLELYRNMGRIRVDQLPAWLCTVVKHRAVDYWRRDRLEKRYLEEQLRKPPAQERGGGRFLEWTATLKPTHATCLLLRYVHGMSRAEIAKATGMTEIQVKSSLQYARELLRRELAGESHNMAEPR
jgi:RNA polymerase sigma-70 factor, ECF subfamily